MREDWKEVRLKDVTILNPSITEELDEFVSFVPMENLRNGFINNSDKIQFQDGKGKYTYFSNGDLLLAKVTPCFENGNIAIAENLLNKNGFGSSEIFVLRTLKNISKYFLFYYSQSSFFREKAISTMSGVAGLKRISSLFMRTHSFPLPPLATQHAIANYLDKKLAVIDSNISLLEQKRDRYTALRKSLINQVVRRGLNPDVELKNSGIEWLGEIPKHWKVKRVKDVSTFINGYAFDSDDFLEAGVPVIKIGNITETNIDYENTLKVTENNSLIGYEIKQNDILIAMSGATIGKNTIVQENKKAYINQRVGIIRSKSNNYLQYLLNIKAFLDYILLTNASSAQPNISSTNISNFFIPFPPLAEQHAIADYLDKQSDKIDRIVENINAQLGKLAQLKKSLINECVTGEREVIAHKI